MIFNEILKGLAGGSVKYEHPQSSSVYSAHEIRLTGISHEPFCVAWLYSCPEYSSGGTWYYSTFACFYLKDASGNEVLNQLRYGAFDSGGMTITYEGSSNRLNITYPHTIYATGMPPKEEIYCFYTE